MKKIGFKINNTLIAFECNDNTFNKLKSVEFNVNLVNLTNIDNTFININVAVDVAIVLLLLLESTIDYSNIIDEILDSYDKFIDNDIEFLVNIKELIIIFRVMIKNMNNNINVIVFNSNVTNAMTNRFKFLI